MAYDGCEHFDATDFTLLLPAERDVLASWDIFTDTSAIEQRNCQPIQYSIPQFIIITLFVKHSTQNNHKTSKVQATFQQSLQNAIIWVGLQKRKTLKQDC